MLYKQIQALEARITKLEANSVSFSTHQQGALPGSLRAVTINDPNQSGAMWMNFSNAGPGQGPYSAVTDLNGIIRAEWGNLAQNSISPAQYGFRANDDIGNPIFDSEGLISVMSEIGTATDNNPDTITSLTPVVLGGVVTTPITVQRNISILAMCWSTGRLAGGAGNFCIGNIYLDGVLKSPTAIWEVNNPGYIQCSVAQLLFASAGTHTVDWRMSVDNAALTWTNFQTVLDVFLLGG